jgi:hypothetical protein
VYSHRAWNPYCVASYALLVTECCFCREMEGHIRTASISVNMALLIIDEQLVSSHPFAFLYMDELCLGSIAGTISKFLVWDMKTIFEGTPKSLNQNQHVSYIYIFLGRARNTPTLSHIYPDCGCTLPLSFWLSFEIIFLDTALAFIYSTYGAPFLG